MGKQQQENSRRAMQSDRVAIIDYDPGNPLHKERFAALNREWLTTYFFVEDEDERAFRDPQGKILDKDGVILLVEAAGEIIGTGSLLKMQPSGYEIAKMA